MLRQLILCLLLLTGIAAFAANVTVVIDGKTVTVPVIEANGKAFVDIVALMQLLGGKASYNAAAHKIAITTKSSASGSSGTAELAGDNGELAKVYSLVKSNPLYFSLKSAEFTTSQVVISDTLYAPKADEKLLVLHFTVQNPQQSEKFIRWDSLRFTVVDAMNVNHESVGDWGDEKSHNSIGLSLKPAQKLEAYTAIVVPAKGVIPKLMVLPPGDNDGPILRYDLKGKVTGLKAPVADPADTTGATALETVPAVLNTAYSYANFDITVEKIEYTTAALNDDTLEDGDRYLVATLLMKNKAPGNVYTRWDSLAPTLTGKDGEELKYHDMILASSSKSFSQEVKAGQEIHVRLYFTVPKDSTAKTLALKEGDSRTYEIAVKE
ncbi:MAG: DUF4352 domain-containing protein [Armatimonadota bacterium]